MLYIQFTLLSIHCTDISGITTYLPFCNGVVIMNFKNHKIFALQKLLDTWDYSTGKYEFFSAMGVIKNFPVEALRLW